MPADLEQLKMKYGSVLNAINQSGVRLAHVHIQDDKLYIEGACGSEAIKNKIWDQAKLVDPSYSDLTLNLTVDPSLAPKQQIYTVAAGDSLSKIAKQFYGNANEYMKIFDANKDKLTDPNAIKVGQQLVIPS
ncbi:MAG TPA: LysM peptidoglycan-binding domain-containing protein [Candidatus Acidoferrum sp.]|jgi:nucleoid-associated protein YgaU|nr:LysM peptidoglycan-binding domain-containing protein [Candidatus Acidoferrum sp.]